MKIEKVISMAMVAMMLLSSLVIMVSSNAQAGQTYVVEPQGGETWYTGETHLIKWWGYAWYPYVDTQIDLYKVTGVGTSVYVMEVYRTNSTVIGEYYWTIPRTIEPGQYYIQAQINDGHEPMPEQSGIFTIYEGDSAPLLFAIKTGPASAYVGDEINYTITVQHDAASDGSNVVNLILDDTLGTPIYFTGDDGDGILQANEVWTYYMLYTVKDSDPNPLYNVVNASGYDLDGDIVWDLDDHSVEILDSGKICGTKWYDLDIDGVKDANEDTIEGFKIQLYDSAGALIATVFTNSEGEYCFDHLPLSDYIVKEVPPNSQWLPTTSMSIAVSLTSAEKISEGNDFGNICLGEGGGMTKGYWTNKNGQRELTVKWSMVVSSGVLSDPIFAGLPYTKTSPPFFTTPLAIKTFLVKAEASVKAPYSMRYMLAAQYLAMKLNVITGHVVGSSVIYVGDLNYNGLADASDFMAANAVLSKVRAEWNTWNRSTQEYWNKVLDNGNNNKIFLCSNPCAITY